MRINLKNEYLFHAGTAEKNGKIFAVGGRVLNFISLLTYLDHKLFFCQYVLTQLKGVFIMNNERDFPLYPNEVTKELVKGYVSWEINKYDPFFNINNYNDLKFAENMIKNEIIN